MLRSYRSNNSTRAAAPYGHQTCARGRCILTALVLSWIAVMHPGCSGRATDDSKSMSEPPVYTVFSATPDDRMFSKSVVRNLLSTFSLNVVSLDYPNPGRHALHTKVDLIEGHAIRYPKPVIESSVLIDSTDAILPFLLAFGYEDDKLRFNVVHNNGGTSSSVAAKKLGSNFHTSVGDAFPIGKQTAVFYYGEKASGETFRMSSRGDLEDFVDEFERVIVVYVTIEPLVEDEFLDA